MTGDAPASGTADAFGAVYSGIYDVLYRDKDYEAECDLLERIFRDHGRGAVRRVLDLGCGTGNHALPLTGRGYGVAGVDLSEAMLAGARQKAAGLGAAAPSFHVGDARSVDLGRRFDAVLMMFAVLGYSHANADLTATLATVRRHLEPGGLFVFDVWYGPGVLTDRPGPRIRTLATATGRVIRTTNPVLDLRHHRCHVHFEVLCLEGDRLVREVREEHVMRFYFPLELDLALRQAGLTLETLRAFPDYDREPDERTWNVIGVARAGGG